MPFAHLLHMTPRDVDELSWQEFDVLTDWIDEYLDGQRNVKG